MSNNLDPRKECPLCAELGKHDVPVALSSAWYSSHELCEPKPPPEGMPPDIAKAWAEDQSTRPKVHGMEVVDYEALPEEEKAGYWRGEKWGCGRVDRGVMPCTMIRVKDGKVTSEPGTTRVIGFFHKWNVWDKDGEAKWSRSTCVHGAMWTGVVPCFTCGSFDVMLSPYDPNRSEEETDRRTKVELKKRIGNIRRGYEAGKTQAEANERDT